MVSNQRVHRLESLRWRGARLPIADDLPQQGDEGIGLLLMLAAIVGQGVIGLLMELLEATDAHLRQVVQGLSRLDTHQGDREGHPFGLLHGLHAGGVQRSGFFGKALQLRFGNPLDGLTRTVQGLQPPRMGDMLANAFRRRAFGFAFETRPRTGCLLGLARQEASDRRPRHVVERGGPLLVIAHVDLGTRFLRGPT